MRSLGFVFRVMLFCAAWTSVTAREGLAGNYVPPAVQRAADRLHPRRLASRPRELLRQVRDGVQDRMRRARNAGQAAGTRVAGLARVADQMARRSGRDVLRVMAAGLQAARQHRQRRGRLAMGFFIVREPAGWVPPGGAPGGQPPVPLVRTVTPEPEPKPEANSAQGKRHRPDGLDEPGQLTNKRQKTGNH